MLQTFLASSISEQRIEAIVKPVLDICESVLPVLIGVVGAIALIYCVVLGVKFARTTDPQEHEKAKNGLKNAIIGFVLIFVLLLGCKIGISVFTDWWENYNTDIISVLVR